MTLPSKLRELISGGDWAGTVAFWTANRPSLEMLECAHQYPAKHRLFDFQIDGVGYRVSRCADCEERISMEECPGADDRMPGVPLELSGWRLRTWIERERQQNSKAPVPWAEYLELSEDNRW